MIVMWPALIAIYCLVLFPDPTLKEEKGSGWGLYGEHNSYILGLAPWLWTCAPTNINLEYDWSIPRHACGRFSLYVIQAESPMYWYWPIISEVYVYWSTCPEPAIVQQMRWYIPAVRGHMTMLKLWSDWYTWNKTADGVKPRIICLLVPRPLSPFWG